MKHTEGRIIIKVNFEVKNSHKMDDGTILRLERGWNNLNMRETAPVNANVVSGDGLKEGAEILCHHNAFHETYKITNHSKLSGQKIADRIEYFSIPEEQAFFWRDGETWLPLRGFATGLRVFRPYKGILHGIDPTKLKDVLLITSGSLKGKVCMTLRAADYQLVFQDITGKESNIIRCRHYEDSDNEREEIVCIHDQYTKEVKAGKLFVGLTTTDCKPLKEIVHA